MDEEQMVKRERESGRRGAGTGAGGGLGAQPAVPAKFFSFFADSRHTPRH